MRSIVAATVALGGLLFASCSKTQHETIVANVEDGIQSQTESHGSAAPEPAADVHGERGHTAHQPEMSQELGRDHANHNVSKQYDHVHRVASSHEIEQSSRNERKRLGGPHHVGHGHANDGHETGDNSKKVAIGGKVPDFDVTINGKLWKLSELQANTAMTEDGTLVLTFWCSFCHSCRHVEHALDELAKQYKGKVGVVALDASAGETTEEVAAFAKERELTFPIAIDSSGTTADIFGTRVTTTTVVIDNEGVLRFRGQFGDGEHAFAQDALRAVVAGEDVPVQETQQKG